MMHGHFGNLDGLFTHPTLSHNSSYIYLPIILVFVLAQTLAVATLWQQTLHETQIASRKLRGFSLISRQLGHFIRFMPQNQSVLEYSIAYIFLNAQLFLIEALAVVEISLLDNDKL